jgi:hypothetical protein
MLTSMKILALGLERLGKSEEIEESMRGYPSNTSTEKVNDTNNLDGIAAGALPGSN